MTAQSSDHIAIGIIRKAHGVRGEASVEPWTDSLDRFFDLKSVVLVSPDEASTRDVNIESVRPHSGRVLMKFVGIETPEDLRLLSGWSVEVPESEARKLDEGEYFLHDLVGLRIVDDEGRDRGVVADAYEGGGGVLLEVKHVDRTYDLPFAAEICTVIDIAGKRIVARIPDGLDDLQNVASIEDEMKGAPAGSHPESAEPRAGVREQRRSAAKDLPSEGRPGGATNVTATEPPDQERAAILRIDFVTIFPRMFDPLLTEGVIARGVKQGLIDARVWDLRDFTTDKHRSTDDEAYGGGPGMVMLAEPILRAVEKIEADGGRPARRPSAVPAGGNAQQTDAGETQSDRAEDAETASVEKQQTSQRGEDARSAVPAGETQSERGENAETASVEKQQTSQRGEDAPPAVPAGGTQSDWAEDAETASVEKQQTSQRGEDAPLLAGGTPAVRPHVVLTSPKGRVFTQSIARELAANKWIVILCGRYEGFDHRVHEALQPDEISIGDYVVSGGELPAMIIADAAGRMIEGVVGNSGSVEEDSFFHGILDYPHYTRPEELRGMRVPDVLLGGHHEKIRRWRKEQALRATLEKRPDLLDSAELDDEAREILYAIDAQSRHAKAPRAKPHTRGRTEK